MRVSGNYIVAALMATCLATPAVAELIVENSSAPGVQIDAKLPDNYVFDVPAGAKVELTRTSDRTTHVINGKRQGYKGTLADYLRRGCGLRDAECGDGLRGGGIQGVSPVPGGTRGARRPE